MKRDVSISYFLLLIFSVPCTNKSSFSGKPEEEEETHAQDGKAPIGAPPTGGAHPWGLDRDPSRGPIRDPDQYRCFGITGGKCFATTAPRIWCLCTNRSKCFVTTEPTGRVTPTRRKSTKWTGSPKTWAPNSQYTPRPLRRRNLKRRRKSRPWRWIQHTLPCQLDSGSNTPRYPNAPRRL